MQLKVVNWFKRHQINTNVCFCPLSYNSIMTIYWGFFVEDCKVGHKLINPQPEFFLVFQQKQCAPHWLIDSLSCKEYWHQEHLLCISVHNSAFSTVFVTESGLLTYDDSNYDTGSCQHNIPSYRTKMLQRLRKEDQKTEAGIRVLDN